MSKLNSDVVVVGAGVSGLLIASELSKYHSVLLIEKEKQIPSHKYWVTGDKSLRYVPELTDCIDIRYESMDFLGYDGTLLRAIGRAILWDTKELVGRLTDIINRNRCKIELGRSFYNLSHLKGELRVNYNDSVCTTRLLVDCMGLRSPLMHIKNAYKPLGFYGIYGRLVELERPINPIALANISINRHPRYLEVFPTKNNSAYFSLIYPARHMRTCGGLSEEFEFVVKKSQMSQYIKKNIYTTNHFSGLIPVGVMKKKALDNIYFYGEAGQLNPAATATCLHRMLLTYKDTASQLSKKIQSKRLDRKSLAETTGPVTIWNQKIQVGLFKRILDWDSHDFADVLKELSALPPNVFERFLSGDIKKRDTRCIPLFLNLIKKRQVKLFGVLARSIWS